MDVLRKENILVQCKQVTLAAKLGEKLPDSQNWQCDKGHNPLVVRSTTTNLPE